MTSKVSKSTVSENHDIWYVLEHYSWSQFELLASDEELVSGHIPTARNCGHSGPPDCNI